MVLGMGVPGHNDIGGYFKIGKRSFAHGTRRQR